MNRHNKVQHGPFIQPSQSQSMPSSLEGVGLQNQTTHAEGSTSTNGSSIGQKRTRGPTRNLKLVLIPPGEKLALEFNKHGQAVGSNATLFANYLSRIVKHNNNSPLSFIHWIDIPEDKKHKMYKLALDKFGFEETPLRKEKIMQKLCRKFGDYKSKLKRKFYDPYKTDKKRLRRCSLGVPLVDWAAFIHYYNTPEAQEMCARNRRNRAKEVI